MLSKPEIALAATGLADAICYMLVTPSLIFYVLENGGTKEQYGLIMSSFSFTSFCFKPILGWSTDVLHNFRVPYLVSLAVAAAGGLCYLLASTFPPGNAAVGAILMARALGGAGAANSALAYAYVARGTPQEEQTSTNSMLSMMRILGMAAGPGVNLLVARVDIDIGGWNLNPLNSVGLILIFCNIVAILTIYFMLDEPEYNDEEEESNNRQLLSKQTSSFAASTWEVIRAIMSLDILVPMLSIFTFNAAFQLIETGFAPAAYDALGWGPVQTSVALGSISFIIALNMYVVMVLSKRKVSDSVLLAGGLVISFFAYLSLYYCWVQNASAFQFYAPIVFAASSFPFLAAPTRSIFTVSVDSKAVLKKYQGSMQAFLSMWASVAGFVAPGLIAAYCLRHPDEVDSSSDKRELTGYSLFAPVLSLLTLIGLSFISMSSGSGIDERIGDAMIDANSLSTSEEATLSETSVLLSGGKRRSSMSMEGQRGSIIAVRSSACQVMGLTQTTDDEVL